MIKLARQDKILLYVLAGTIIGVKLGGIVWIIAGGLIGALIGEAFERG